MTHVWLGRVGPILNDKRSGCHKKPRTFFLSFFYPTRPDLSHGSHLSLSLQIPKPPTETSVPTQSLCLEKRVENGVDLSFSLRWRRRKNQIRRHDVIFRQSITPRCKFSPPLLRTIHLFKASGLNLVFPFVSGNPESCDDDEGCGCRFGERE